MVSRQKLQKLRSVAMFLLSLLSLSSADIIFNTIDNSAINHVGVDNSILLSVDDYPRIAYHEQSVLSAGGDLKFAYCEDVNCTAVQLQVVDSDPAGANVGRYLSMVVDQVKRPVMSYINSTGGFLKIVRCGNDRCSTGNTIEIPDPGAQALDSATSIQMTALGYPVVAYVDGLKNDLRVVHCQTQTCSAATRNSPAPMLQSVGAVSMQLNQFGFPVITHATNDTQDLLEVFTCGDEECTRGSSVVVWLGPVGQQVSLQLQMNTFKPVLSMHDATNKNLVLVYCSTKYNCSSGVVLTVVDSQGSVGSYNSLQLDNNNYPVIAYFQNTGTALNLRICSCGSVDCSSGNVINTIRSMVDSGLYVALALSSEGLPVMAEQLIAGADLGFVRCTDSHCTEGATSVAAPSRSPTVVLSLSPSSSPSLGPTLQPTTQPTGLPSVSPSRAPTHLPSPNPSAQPSATPTQAPSAGPSQSLTNLPSIAPTQMPTVNPTAIGRSASPSASSSQTPTGAPTTIPAIPGDLVIPGNVILLDPVDASTGNLIFAGSLTLASNLTVSSARPVNVTGILVLGGHLILNLDGKPRPGSQIQVFFSPSSAQGRFDSIEVTFAGQRTCQLVVASDSMANTGFSVSVNVVDRCGGLPPAALAGIIVGTVVIVVATLGSILLVNHVKVKRRTRANLQRLADATEMKMKK